MRALLQRVSRAEVRVGGERVGSIGRGLLVLLGVGPQDDEATADALARRIVELRIHEDAQGRTNLALGDVGGAVLAVSQFTLYADTRRGRRPVSPGRLRRPSRTLSTGASARRSRRPGRT